MGAFLVAVGATAAIGAEAPKYDATGTWNYQVSDGWVSCPGESPPSENGTVLLNQFGSTFTTNNMGHIQAGTVSGSRYVMIENQSGVEEGESTNVTWDLISSALGKGYVSGVWSDGSSFCNYGADITLQKTSGTCVPSDTKLCLNQGRFAVQMTWNFQSGASGQGKAVPAGSDDSGILYFNNPSDWQLLVKVLDGCSVNNRYWVFFAATTDQQFTLTVTDTQTAQQVQYTNPLKQKANAVTDTSAFATCQ
jgi:hypothetical protein